MKEGTGSGEKEREKAERKTRNQNYSPPAPRVEERDSDLPCAVLEGRSEDLGWGVGLVLHFCFCVSRVSRDGATEKGEKSEAGAEVISFPPLQLRPPLLLRNPHSHSRWQAPLLTSSPRPLPDRRGSETAPLGASASPARRRTATAWPTTSRAPGRMGFEYVFFS